MYDGFSAVGKLALVDFCAAAREGGWWSGGMLRVCVVEPDGTRATYAIPPETLAWVERFKVEVRPGWEAFERQVERELVERGEYDAGLFRSARARAGRRRVFGLPPQPSTLPAGGGARRRARRMRGL